MTSTTAPRAGAQHPITDPTPTTISPARTTGPGPTTLAALAAGSLLLGGLAGWWSHTVRERADSADAVIRTASQGTAPELCLETSVLGPGDGAGTCGYPVTADDAPALRPGTTVKVRVLPEKKDGRPVFLVSHATG